jgi:hypothetical protein
MVGVSDEPRVFVVGDRMNAEAELVDVRRMRRTCIFVAVLVAHDELASGDGHHRRQQFIGHLLWVECT